jgi:hypothetical protein
LQTCLRLCRFTQALLKPGFARWKVSLAPRVARESSYNILSERMTYYSRYATRRKGVMLGFSLLQLATSKLGVVAIPEAQLTQSLPCSTVFWHILAASTDSHVPTCLSSDRLCTCHHWSCTEAHLCFEVSTLCRCSPPNLVSMAPYLFFLACLPKDKLPQTKIFLRSSYLDRPVLDQATVRRFLLL